MAKYEVDGIGLQWNVYEGPRKVAGPFPSKQQATDWIEKQRKQDERQKANR